MSKKDRRSSAGHVYLIRSELGQYKIGKTSHLHERLLSFGVTLPFKVELVHAIPTTNTSWAELELHQQYAEKRISGEWFALEAEDVDYFCRIEVMDPRATWVRRKVPLTDEELAKELASLHPDCDESL